MCLLDELFFVVRLREYFAAVKCILTLGLPCLWYPAAAHLQTAGAALCRGLSQTPVGGLPLNFPFGVC